MNIIFNTLLLTVYILKIFEVCNCKFAELIDSLLLYKLSQDEVDMVKIALMII